MTTGTTRLSGAKTIYTNSDGSDLGFIFSVKDILDTQAAPGIKLPDKPPISGDPLLKTTEAVFMFYAFDGATANR